MRMFHHLRSHHLTRAFSPMAPRRQTPRTAYVPCLDHLEGRIALSTIFTTAHQLVVSAEVGTFKAALKFPLHLTVGTVKTPLHITTVTSPTSIKSVQTTTANNGSHSSSSIQTIQTTTSNGSASISQVHVESVQWD